MTWDTGQKIIEKKLNLFGHMCRMADDRSMKRVVFGIIEMKD